jgi:hypothetical protein
MAQIDPIVGKGGVIFHPVVIRNGQVVANWKRTDRKGVAQVHIQPFTGAPRLESRALDKALFRYSNFLGMPVEHVS